MNLTQGGLGLPDESYYRDDKFAEIREKYVDYVQRLLELAGREDAQRVARGVLELETRIAKGHWERHETRDVQRTYNLTTHAELRTLLPAFDWSAYAEAVSGSDRAFGDSLLAEVIVRQPSFFTHLQEVLTETPLEAFKELLVVKVIRSTAGYLSSEFVETNFDFYGRTLNGTPELRARWKRGISFVEGTLGEAVSKRYVERHFPPESKAMMDELVANLLEAYRRSITGLDWMSEETKQRAFDKIDTFKPKIGYPDTWRDYSALEVSADDLLGNLLASAAFETDRELRKIGAPVDRDEWLMLAAPRQRLLQADHQRDLLPGRHPAAALLRPGRPGGRELRRHRRRDRSRDRARLRRPGRTVRRRRQPQRLVDRRRQGGVRGEVEGADRAVRRVRAPQPPRRARQRRADRRREHRRPRWAHHRPQGLRDRARELPRRTSKPLTVGRVRRRLSRPAASGCS